MLNLTSLQSQKKLFPTCFYLKTQTMKVLLYSVIIAYTMVTRLKLMYHIFLILIQGQDIFLTNIIYGILLSRCGRIPCKKWSEINGLIFSNSQNRVLKPLVLKSEHYLCLNFLALSKNSKSEWTKPFLRKCISSKK